MLCFNHLGEINFQAGQECCTRSHWALLWGDASPELLTFQTMMYHFFLPFLFILAGQGLTTDSLSPKASHQPAQEHYWPEINPWILCMVQIRKKKEKIIAANHDLWGPRRRSRVFACCLQRSFSPWPLFDRENFALEYLVSPEPWSTLSGHLEMKVILS